MGCGRVGASLARELQRRGHSVAVVDQSEASFRRLGASFEGKTVTGMGFDRDTLAEAGTHDAFAFAAVSSGDNSNILAARVARETFGVDNVVARIYDPRRAEVYQRLGIPTVATVAWARDQVLRRLLPHGAAPAFTDPSGTIQLSEIALDPTWVGSTVAEIEARSGARVAFVFRTGQSHLPSPETMYQDGDQMYFIVEVERSATVERVLGRAPVQDE